MGRFHRHEDGTEHSHDHTHDHDHPHEHGDHSGYATGGERIEILEAIFSENDSRAAVNRKAFEDNGVRVLNLMSSPGSGKTTVLAATLDALAGEVSSASSRAISPPTSMPPAWAAGGPRSRC